VPMSDATVEEIARKIFPLIYPKVNEGRSDAYDAHADTALGEVAREVADVALEAARQREARLRNNIDNIVMAFDLRSDHCELEQAINHARAALADTESEE